MQDYFLWNGVDCRTYSIHVTEQPPITIPLERSTQTMNGEFPVLKPGANAISWTGAVTKVVVRPNWRYL